MASGKFFFCPNKQGSKCTGIQIEENFSRPKIIPLNRKRSSLHIYVIEWKLVQINVFVVFCGDIRHDTPFMKSEQEFSHHITSI